MDGFLPAMEKDADTLEERFNLMALRPSPATLKNSAHSLKRSSSGDDSDSSDSSDSSDDEDEGKRIESAIETASENLGKAVISWGFDPVIVNSWLSDTASDWENLNNQQKIEEAQLAKSKVQEAADYAKSILDNMMADFVATSEEHQEAIQDATQS